MITLAALILLAALLLAWYALRPATAPPPAAPVREHYDTSRPLKLEVLAHPGTAAKQAQVSWLDYELRQLLLRANVQLAPAVALTEGAWFTLRIEYSTQPTILTATLRAPDQAIERQRHIPLTTQSRLATLRTLAAELPSFLGITGASDWAAAIGTTQTRAYEAYLASVPGLLGPASQGYTRPSLTLQRPRVAERLESLTRREPTFARAWAALALAYLSLGGPDESALLQLAEISAERALSLDDRIAEASAALGLVRLRRGEWIEAHGHLWHALALNPDSAAALEGAGCLLADTGHHRAARSMLERAVLLQPGNLGAHECLAYTQPGPTGKAAPATPAQLQTAVRVRALAAILEGDLTAARRLLRSAVSRQGFIDWADPLLSAAGNPQQIAPALKAITLAANEDQIDPATEILCGVALRQSHFVFNRLARLQRKHQHVPLRVLWLPRTAFLRRHPGFAQVTGNAGLPAFWQQFGSPDVCTGEPEIYGCRLAPAGSRPMTTHR